MNFHTVSERTTGGTGVMVSLGGVDVCTLTLARVAWNYPVLYKPDLILQSEVFYECGSGLLASPSLHLCKPRRSDGCVAASGNIISERLDPSLK